MGVESDLVEVDEINGHAGIDVGAPGEGGVATALDSKLALGLFQDSQGGGDILGRFG